MIVKCGLFVAKIRCGCRINVALVLPMKSTHIFLQKYTSDDIKRTFTSNNFELFSYKKIT